MRVFSPVLGGEGAEPPYASSPSPPAPLPRITGGEGSQSVFLSRRSVARCPRNVLIDTQRLAIFVQSSRRQSLLAARDLVGHALEKKIDLRAARPNGLAVDVDVKRTRVR